MNFQVNDLIDSRFKVTGICSNSGGMGQILFVSDITNQISQACVLKYCREPDKKYIQRFKREVRLLEKFQKNPKIVDLLCSNVDYNPPYFVMKFYQSGDLTNIIEELKMNPVRQEDIFNKMIDCIYELHNNDVFHRDIKPQNFLIDGNTIVVSDFGLGIEPSSTSRFTQTSEYWGTYSFLPPEFQNGDFKKADEKGDIYMLGKSFYSLLTGDRNPTYISRDNISPTLFNVIEKACELDKNKRYDSLYELKESLKIAFDVVLERSNPQDDIIKIVLEINNNNFQSDMVIEMFNKLPLIEDEYKIDACLKFQKTFFQ